MQTLEGMETDIRRMKDVVSTFSQSLVCTADAMKAVHMTNDQVVKLSLLFDKRLDILGERIDVVDGWTRLFERYEERIERLEEEVEVLKERLME